MNCSGVPFTHICEWKRHSPSSSSSSSSRWSLMVAMVALGSASMICHPLSSSDSESKPTSDSKSFTSATSDCFEQKSTMLCHGILWKSHHLPISFFVFSVSLFACDLNWLSWGCLSLLYPLFCWLGPAFPGFFLWGVPSPIFSRILFELLLDFDGISVGRTQGWDVQKLHFDLDVSMQTVAILEHHMSLRIFDNPLGAQAMEDICELG